MTIAKAKITYAIVVASTRTSTVFVLYYCCVCTKPARDTLACTVIDNGDTLSCGSATYTGLGTAASAVLSASFTQEFKCTDTFAATAGFDVRSDHGNTVIDPQTATLEGGNPGECSPLTLTKTTGQNCGLVFFDGAGNNLNKGGRPLPCTIRITRTS